MLSLRLSDGYDFGDLMFRENRIPIAMPIVSSEGYALSRIHLGSDSIDPDGNIVSYEWYTYNGDPKDNTFGILNPGSNNAFFEAEYPGYYTIVLTVTDDRGAKDTLKKKIMVYNEGGCPFPFPAVCSMYWEPEMPDWMAKEHLKALRQDNVKWIAFNPVWFFSDINRNEIIPIY